MFSSSTPTVRCLQFLQKGAQLEKATHGDRIVVSSSSRGRASRGRRLAVAVFNAILRALKAIVIEKVVAKERTQPPWTENVSPRTTTVYADLFRILPKTGNQKGHFV